MKQETKTTILPKVKFVGVLILGLSIGLPIGIQLTRWEAIDHDAAHYHPKTGNVVWGPDSKESAVLAVVQSAIMSCKVSNPIGNQKGIEIKDGMIDDVCNLVKWEKK